jgi:hypothetical protein
MPCTPCTLARTKKKSVTSVLSVSRVSVGVIDYQNLWPRHLIPHEALIKPLIDITILHICFMESLIDENLHHHADYLSLGRQAACFVAETGLDSQVYELSF